MTQEQLKKIMDAMQGITYLDWEKLSLCISSIFNAEISKQANGTRLTDSERVIEEYKHYSSTI